MWHDRLLVCFGSKLDPLLIDNMSPSAECGLASEGNCQHRLDLIARLDALDDRQRGASTCDAPACGVFCFRLGLRGRAGPRRPADCALRSRQPLEPDSD
jgi:hypothetical protein